MGHRGEEETPLESDRRGDSRRRTFRIPFVPPPPDGSRLHFFQLRQEERVVRKSRKRERGIALIITLLILGLVTTVLLSSSSRTSLDLTLSTLYGNRVRGKYIAEGALKAALIALREDAGMNSYDTLDEIWSRPSPPIQFGEGEALITVVDEERKFNINSLILPGGLAPNERMVAIFQGLLTELGIDPLLTDAVLDWLDSDDTPRPAGAESEYYSSLPHPYSPKNDLFDTLSELLLVRGFTREVYEKLAPFITVHSSGKININTAPPEILRVLALGEEPEFQGLLDERSVEDVINYRSENPFEKPEDLGNVSSSLEELYRKTRIREVITTSSTTFTVDAIARVGKGRYRIVSLLTRSGESVEEISRIVY
ncbi:MAG: general secretion pathway protein GspK [Deltaproteobacteria bacterium]|nr:MAG: general secretion pathway protein GspK [Deltaproteobacteria bacterium]